MFFVIIMNSFDAKLLARFVKLGLLIAIKNASIQTSKLFVNSRINSYGVAVSAFAGVANKINSAAILLARALNTAGASIIGHNIVAKKFERVKKIMDSVFAAAISVSSLILAEIVLFPDEIFGLFTSDVTVLEIGASYLPLAVFFFAGSACRAPMTSLINGNGNYLANFMTALLDRLILRIGLAVLFGLGLNLRHWDF